MLHRGIVSLALAMVAAAGSNLLAQGGGYGGGGMRGGYGAPEFPVPKLPGQELDGPPDSAAIVGILNLNPAQLAQYVQRYDSFLDSTKPQRDSAHLAEQKMNDRLDSGDRAAATFYADRLHHYADFLKDRQERFEHGLNDFLSKDQQKQYKDWKDSADRAAAERNKEAALRWQSPLFATGMRMGGGTRGLAPPAARSGVSSGAAPAPSLGSQAVRVGRAVYVSAQVSRDSAGALVGAGDLRAQAARAFANLTAVLQSAGLTPADVVTLRVYVVGYRAQDLAVVREAAAAYLSSRVPPGVTVLGVQALSGEGELIAVEATAGATD